MNAFFTFDLFMVYIQNVRECKQKLRTMKKYTQIRDIAHLKSGLQLYYSQRNVQ